MRRGAAGGTTEHRNVPRSPRRFLQRVALGLVLCAGTFCSAVEPVSAQGKAAANSEYDRVLKEALDEFGRGNWVEARTLFERAHRMEPSARTLRAIGLASFEEKRYVVALGALRESLAMPVKPLTAKQRREVEEAIRRAESFVVQYTLELSPEDAQVLIDGAPAVIVDGKLQLDPGGHELTVSAEGHENVERRIVANSGGESVLRVRLPALGSDDDDARPVTVVPGPDAATDRTPPEDDGLSTIQYIGIGVGAAGVLSLGASLYFALSAKSKYDDSGCDDGGCRDRAAQELNEDALASGDIATVTAIAGLVAVAAGTTLLIWNPSSDAQAESESAGLGVTPLVAPGRAGARVSVRF